jgi:uncharacterized protein with FMN-binding domain
MTVSLPARVLSLLSALLVSMAVLGSCAVDKAALAKRVDLRSPDLGSVADGTYEATYTIDPPTVAANKSVSVRVRVSGGRYTSIEILRPPRIGESKPFKELISRVEQSQVLSMDAVSGATITSTAILKAIQNAVSSPRK